MLRDEALEHASGFVGPFPGDGVECEDALAGGVDDNQRAAAQGQHGRRQPGAVDGPNGTRDEPAQAAPRA